MTLYDMPSLDQMRANDVSLKVSNAISRTRGGQVSVVNLASPVWRARYETYALDQFQFSAWRAWWLRLEGGLHTFKAYDFERLLPQSVVKGQSTLPSSGQAAVNVSGSSLTLSALPGGFILTEGDMVSFLVGGRMSLFSLTSSAVASGSGAATVQIHPAVRSGQSIGSLARISNAYCEMVPDPDSWSAGRSITPGAVSFSGVQALP